MLLLARQVQEGFHHGIRGEESEIETTRLHNLQQNDIIAGDLHLMVILPCDLCPHHYQHNHRLAWGVYGCGGHEYFTSERIEENLTDEELEVAAQLMELSSQSLHLAEETSNSFVAEGLESSSISDSRRSYGLTPRGKTSRRVLNVDIEERSKPRSRSVNEMFKQSTASRKRRRGLQAPG